MMQEMISAIHNTFKPAKEAGYSVDFEPTEHTIEVIKTLYALQK